MPLLVREAYLAIRKGQQPTQFTCAGCGQEYYCFVREFEHPSTVVAPCPACGDIQPSMLAAAKGQLAAHAGLIGLVVFLVGMIVFGTALLPGLLGTRDATGAKESNPVLLTVNCIVLGAGLALMLFEWARRRRFDPNASPREERIRLGREVSLTSKTYEEARTQAEHPTFSPVEPEWPVAGPGGGRSSWNSQAIFLVIMGFALTVAGIWSFFDPDAKKIYIGAAVVGPILFFRNVGRVRGQA